MTNNKIIETLNNWDLGDVLDLLNNGVSPQDFTIPNRTDVLNQFILESYSYYVAVILSDESFDFYKNGFNYLLSSLKAVNPEKRDFSIFKDLLDKTGKDMCLMKNDLGVSPWSYAFIQGYLKPIQLMVEKGIDINIPDELGRGALFYYFRNNEVSDNFLRFIIKNKNNIDWNKKDIYSISLIDLLTSARNSYAWSNHENHLKLLNLLEIRNKV